MPRVRLTIEDPDSPTGWREVEGTAYALARDHLLELMDPLQLQELKLRDIERHQVVLRRLAVVVPVPVHRGAA